MTCPCQSGNSYDTCCQPYHQGQAAPTPEALMRSRYSAYCRGLVNYLMKTTHRDHPEFRRNKGDWRVELARYCRGLQGLGLVIVATEPGTATISGQTVEGWVTFAATLQVGDEPGPVVLSERSHFLRDESGRWLYHAGTATLEGRVQL